MEKYNLVAQPRSERKKQAAKRLRREGRVPAVVYGGDDDPIAVSVDGRDLNTGLHTELGLNTVFDLRIDGGDGCDVVARQISRDPLTGDFIHVDLMRVDETKKLVCRVPIEFTGTPKGVRLEGGVLQKYGGFVELLCAPAEVPRGIACDIDELGINEAIHVDELDLGGLEAVADGRSPVAAVHPPRVQVEEELEEEEEGAEEAEAAEGEQSEESAEE
ncbi:MAG: 50S ribosomal protein L25 [Gemmatimonadetes bacterium]|nr:50S ribosomal protein L25 [Gemmatimonadota bacterium]